MKTYSTPYQILLLLFAALSIVLVGLFIYRELFPEYKEYQVAYIELEEMLAELPGHEPAPFKTGIKQIVYYTTTPGPQQIDRCISCHLGMQLPHFSPTRIARDVNGQIVYNAAGIPVQEPNPDYIYTLLPDASREYENVLMAHPLLGAETRPFELHPLEQYGCTSCHSGNGRSLNAKRAHGPVYDELYERAEGSPVNPYVEIDDENDPQIARVFNFKPSHDLLFQTTPLLPGGLMEAKCAACHKPAEDELRGVVSHADVLTQRKERQTEAIQQGIEHDQQAIKALLAMKQELETKGLIATKQRYFDELANPTLTPTERDTYDARLLFLKGIDDAAIAQAKIHNQLLTLTDRLPDKESSLTKTQEQLKKLETAKQPFTELLAFPEVASSSADDCLCDYARGQELFLSQACYGCHRIDGVSRGGVGPDLTEIGLSYPWYVKMSIVWPQGKLPGSAMPNFYLDHEEVEDLLAYLMAQDGDDRSLSQVHKEVLLKAWEAGHPLPWEEPVTPETMQNVRAGMKFFATQGCAACHKLRGFKGDVAFAAQDDQEWFLDTFSQLIGGEQLIAVLNQQSDAIDQKLVRTEEKGTLLEELDWDLIASYYTPFKFAARAKDAQYEAMLAAAITPTQRAEADRFHQEWKERVERVLIMFIQEYGLGRDIGPRLHWSGIWRDKQWLIGHFLNPVAYSPRSIMPTFPFDITKFLTLTHMLQQVGIENRDWLHNAWEVDGFSAPQAFELLCSACHGPNGQGNGPVAEMIYPIPKNLRNALFLKGLTREKALDSILHGVPGTPMPPWGESHLGKPVLSEEQGQMLVDWLYSSLPASPLIGEGKAEKTHLPIELEYTPANIAAGEALFQQLCAHCHGTEAMGNGPRAEAMQDAKPRMLVNLPWLKRESNEQLLLSIKYGVPGTAMPAMGDRTTPEQRMQLLVYIRTLAHEKDLRDRLEDALYKAYDEKIYANLEKGEPVEKLQERRNGLEQVGEQFIARDVDDSLFNLYLQWIANPDDGKEIIARLDVEIERLKREREQLQAKLRSGPRAEALQGITEEMGGWINLKTRFLDVSREEGL